MLRIATTNVDLDAAFAASNPGAIPGPYVLLEMTDTGAGMSAEVQARVFEPFFTTKEIGKGTGLGLATVYGIVKQHGGYIAVESAPGAGTTFRVYLGRVAEAAVVAVPPAMPARPPAGSETLLLVEDDPDLRAFVDEILTSAGYEVLAAADPVLALAAAERHGRRIHLLLTDVVMPQMSGTQLAERLRAAHPGLRVLYTSGYAADVIARHRALEHPDILLLKPFTPAALAEKVREVLDGDARAS